MQLFSKKLSVLAATIFAATSVFSAQENLPKEFEQGYGVGENQMMGAYNSPGRIDVNGALDVFLTGSFIYWTAKEKGLELGATYEKSTTVNTKFGNIGGDYKPGFKVDLGINLDHDSWVLDLEYTRLHMSQHGFVGTNDPVNYSVKSFWNNFGNTNGLLKNVKGKWRLKTDLLDLRLGRPYYLGTYLTIRPTFGFRGGWLDQRLYVKTNTISGDAEVPAHGKTKQNSWLIGPRVGIGSSWLLGAGFRIFGDAYAGLNYQRFHTSHYEQDRTHPETIHTDGHERQVNILTTNFELFTGLGYGTYFDHNNWHVDLLVGYDFQVFFDQNRMREYMTNVNASQLSGVPSEGSAANLLLHGLVVTLRFDF